MTCADSLCQSVVNLVEGKDLVRLERDILIVVHPQTMLLTSCLAFDVEGIVALPDRPIFSQTFKKFARVLAPAHIMHRRTAKQIAFNEVWISQTNAATEHAIHSPTFVAHVLMALLCNICKVNTKAVHVAPAP